MPDLCERCCAPLNPKRRKLSHGVEHPNYCPNCRRRASQKKYDDRLREQGTYRTERRRQKFQREYGLTQFAFIAMLAEQENCCAICKAPFPEWEDAKVDHCHTTGKVRALLCNNCNLGIGYFAESPQRLIAAAYYVKHHNS